jgi:hypothetical protein
VDFSGVVTVVAGVDGKSLESLTDPNAPLGLLARTAPDIYESREVTTKVGTLTVTNPDGKDGDIIIEDANALRRTGGTQLQRTMEDPLELAATETQIAGFDGANEHVFKNGAENVFKIQRVGASNYRFFVNASGGWQEFFTEISDGADSGLDGEFIQGFDWTDIHLNEQTPDKTGTAYYDSNMGSPILPGETSEGFWKLPSGMILQFGRLAQLSGTSFDTGPSTRRTSFTYPVAFSNSVMFATPYLEVNTTATIVVLSTLIEGATTTGLTVVESTQFTISDATLVLTVGYFAIGY